MLLSFFQANIIRSKVVVIRCVILFSVGVFGVCVNELLLCSSSSSLSLSRVRLITPVSTHFSLSEISQPVECMQFSEKSVEFGNE